MAIEKGDKYPSATVTGTDPGSIKPNRHFRKSTPLWMATNIMRPELPTSSLDSSPSVNYCWLHGRLATAFTQSILGFWKTGGLLGIQDPRQNFPLQSCDEAVIKTSGSFDPPQVMES